MLPHPTPFLPPVAPVASALPAHWQPLAWLGVVVVFLVIWGLSKRGEPRNR